MTYVTEPARDKGLITSIFEPYDYSRERAGSVALPAGLAAGAPRADRRL